MKGIKKGSSSITAEILSFARQRRGILLALSAMVIFVTTYLLILPALTLEQQQAEKQGGIDVPAAQQELSDKAANADADSADVQDGVLSCEGKGYTVTADFSAKAGLPLDTELVAEEIREDTDAWRDEALKALQEAEGGEKIGGLEFAKFYDISLQAAEGEIEPAAPVDVTISYDKALKVSDAEHLRIVHFGVSEDGKLVPEVLDAKDVEPTLKKGKLTEATFRAEAFSVYAVVYTVDFHWEANGETFDYSIEGGSTIALSQLFEKLHIDAGVGDVSGVAFSDPSLIEVVKEDGDWTLKSLKAFDTEETLTVKLTNGDSFEVKVTDAHVVPGVSELDPNMTYLISYQEGGVYHVLKTDGTVQNFTSTADFDELGSEYQWTFYYVFTEKDRESSMDYTYYFVRPVAQKTHTIALNEAGENLVQYGTNNVAVIPQNGGGFVFLGYNHTEDKHIELGFEGGQFVAYDDKSHNPKVMQIYEQEPLARYSFTVRTDDPSKGKVNGRNENGVVQNNVDEYIAQSNDNKKNNSQIRASIVSHRDAQGDEKWQFDYWDMDGTKLENVGATISAGGIDIPRNGSVLTAHFKQNPAYDVPDSEKQGTPIESMAAWLEELKSRNIPLNAGGCNKTAEVYDYENRIYRVDLTAQSSLTTFDGTIDLGFMLDVSGSMNFPSLLYESDDVPNHQARRISQINTGNNAQNWGLDTRKTYYIIGDPSGTATVCYLYYYDRDGWGSEPARWHLCDASKDRFNFSANGPFDPATGWSYAGSQNYGDSYYSTSASYIIYEAGDRVTQEDLNDPQSGPILTKHGLGLGDPKTRAFYLEKSLNGTLDELKEILSVLSIASDETKAPEVKVAWNTFRNFLPNEDDSGQLQHEFQPASEGIDLTYDTDTYGGGTSTDAALLDAAGVNRNDIKDRYSDTDRKEWDTDNDKNHTYTLNEESGFQWDDSHTKYAVLITDGAPQRGGKTITRRYVTEAADQLKNRDVKLVTVGLGIDNVPSGKTLMYDIADSLDDQKMFYSAKSGDELQDVLLQIVETIMVNATVQGDVTDTIGDAFYPVDKATGKLLSEGATIDLEGNLTTDTSNPYGTITYDPQTKEYGVKWEMQAFTWDGWHGSVYVKAKEDLLGGNGVKTNDGDAIIEAKAYQATDDSPVITLKDKKYINDDPSQGVDPSYNRFAYRESPRVNINELKFNGNNTDWSVYLGTEVDPKEQLKKLWENITVEEVVKTGKADDTNGDGLPDTGKTTEGNTWYPLAPDSITDNREPNPDDEEAVAAYGERQSFTMNALIKSIAEDSDRTEDYTWWDYTNHEPKWDTFLTEAMKETKTTDSSGKEVTEYGFVLPYDKYSLNGNDNSTIRISLTKEITEGEEADLINKSPHDTTVVNSTKAGQSEDDTDVPVEKYVLTILYSPDYSVVPVGQGGSGHLDFHTGTYGTIYQGHAAGTETSSNTHEINVYAKTIEVEKRKPAANGETELLTDKTATFSLYRKWKETDGEDKKVSLQGYTLNGIALGAPQTDDDYYYLLESKQTEDGISRFTKKLSATDAPYYVVETQAPAEYQQDKAIRIVTVLPGPDTKTDLSGTATTAMPYNWTQGVRVSVDDIPATYVDSNGTQVIPITGDNARDYVLPTDAEGYFKTSVLNTPLGYLQIHKEVTYNNAAPTTAEQKGYLKGTYTFKVYEDENCTIPVTEDGVEKTLTVTIGDDGAAKDSDVISLPVGTYWLKEIVAEGAHALPVGNNPQQIEIKESNTNSSPKVVSVRNDYEFNESDDNMAVDIVKQFTGLTSAGQIPEGYHVVLSYKNNNTTHTVTLGNSSHGTEDGVQVKVTKSEDGMTWTWHVYNIPKGSTDFKVHEENYDKKGFDLAVFVDEDPDPVEAPDEDWAINVEPPRAVLNVVTDQTITSESDLRSYYVGSDYILAVSTNPGGTVVISDTSLNFLQRKAIENAIKEGRLSGSFSTPVRFFSTEQHPAQIVLSSKRIITVTVDEDGTQTVHLPPNTNSMAKGFYVTYNQKTVYNNCEIENRYTDIGVALDILKIDQNDAETKLPGAKFSVHKLDIPQGQTAPVPTGAGTFPGTEIEGSPFTTGEDGTVSINLKQGYYELTETKSPDGYTLTDDMKAYIKVDNGVIFRIEWSAQEGKWIEKANVTEDMISFDAATAAIKDDRETEADESKAGTNALLTVKNEPGVELPNSGGPGTTWIYLIGSMLLIGCGVILIARRRTRVS